MNKLLMTLLFSFFPTFALAAQDASDGALSFAPPASDYSVAFLGNLFGVVDGVVHGTGSQIMGAMFAVFNSAVLTVGGIIIMYTLIVSTMNTAHEGQILGQKWSSIWIPVRSTLGLALLIPKASGYCLMQIFVMWIVVQGVGAADKVWDAALGYLNRGGVIIQAQSNPASTLLTLKDMMGGMSKPPIPVGASTILAGQVCMLGVQKQLEAQRQSYFPITPQSACYSDPTSGVISSMSLFCSKAVPDFLSTVNAVTFQQKNKDQTTPYTLPMPNFDKEPYKSLNGICGSIVWNPFTSISTNNNPASNGITLTDSQLELAKMSRAIAIQQMYLDLSSVAQVMVNNDPQIVSTTTGSGTPASAVATQQFGVPYAANGTKCATYGANCTAWGSVSSTSGGALFNGTEFMGAISDYNGIMAPTLNLNNQLAKSANDNKSREFIANASSQGWIMAGAYFFDLVTLNGNAVTGSGAFDTSSGLESSAIDPTVLATPCKTYPVLCTWFNITPPADGTKYPDATSIPAIAQIESLIDGSNGISTPSPLALDLTSNSNRAVTDNSGASTVYGFINNSLMLRGPGQPGIQPMTFGNVIHFDIDMSFYTLPSQSFSCGNVRTYFFSFCLGEIIGNIFYNYIFRFVYNVFVLMFQKIIQNVVMAFLMIPLQGMAAIFKGGLDTLSQPGVNPIVALATMGTTYINFAANLWMGLLAMAVVSSLIPVFGIFIFALVALSLPLLLAWVGIMSSIGFTTAYYIPILPYMIFTFGAIAWLMSVIEAMVAAPIVALGITHPEGHDAFGKGEAAIMILMNVFLRPAMMIIGYISAIALSYVGIWILNAGYDHAIGFIQDGSQGAQSSLPMTPYLDPSAIPGAGSGGYTGNVSGAIGSTSGSGNYSDWAGIYAYFFSILVYTTMYLAIVQNAFSMISLLPDKVLRWIGGNPESAGQESARWGDEVKAKAGEAGKGVQDGQGQMDKQLGGYGQKGIAAAKGAIGKKLGSGGGVEASGE